MLLLLLAAPLLQASWLHLLLAAPPLLLRASWRRLLVAAALTLQAQASCLQAPLQQLGSPAEQRVS